jgi:serine/threonine protein phosphatase PrpC
VVNSGDSPAIDVGPDGDCKLISSCEKRVRDDDGKKLLKSEQMLGASHDELDVRVHRGVLEQGHTLLLATDGGNDAFSSEGQNVVDSVVMRSGRKFNSPEVAQIVNGLPATQAAEKFVKLSKDKKSPDNITAVVISRH